MRKVFLLTVLIVLLGNYFCLAKPPVQSLSVLSPVYQIDRKYKSMEGPSAAQRVDLSRGQPSELLWIKGMQTQVVGADGTTPMPPQFICHVNLEYDAGAHKTIFGQNELTMNRLATLSQGQYVTELPDGFGLPVMSNEVFTLGTQVLNYNYENPRFQVRHKVTIEFIRDRDLKTPLKPLYQTGGSGMALLEGRDGHWNIPDGNEQKHGASCAIGKHAPNGIAANIYQDNFGRKFTVHWVVPPGRQTYHTNVTKMIDVRYDTTLHYAMVHLHPFAESMELRDITTGKTVFKSRARNPRHGIGLSHVDTFSSRKGVPLFKDHEYEFVSVYNNTSPENQDAMAGLVMFLLDKEFKKPAFASLAAESTR